MKPLISKVLLAASSALLLSSGTAFDSAIAEPLSLILNARVAPLEAPKGEVLPPLIPTRFEILRSKIGKAGPIVLTDPQKLYVDFSREGDPYRLYSTLTGEEEDREKQTSIKDFPMTIKDLSMITGRASELYLRATGFPAFQASSLIQETLLVDDLCQKDLEKNEANCSIIFPSFQVFDANTSNISSIRTKVFRMGEVTSTELSQLPTEVLRNKDEFMEENSRKLEVKKNSTDFQGYFLYATYHFEATLKECIDPIKNEEVNEWRFSLVQAPGRLALISGSFIVEQEIQYADGKKILRSSEMNLKWGDYKSTSDIVWEKSTAI